MFQACSLAALSELPALFCPSLSHFLWSSDPLSAEELERGRLLARRYVVARFVQSTTEVSCESSCPLALCFACRYTIGLMRRHKIQEKDLQQKIRHKWRAIHALPTLELRKEVRNRLFFLSPVALALCAPSSRFAPLLCLMLPRPSLSQIHVCLWTDPWQRSRLLCGASIGRMMLRSLANESIPLTVVVVVLGRVGIFKVSTEEGCRSLEENLGGYALSATPRSPGTAPMSRPSTHS